METTYAFIICLLILVLGLLLFYIAVHFTELLMRKKVTFHVLFKDFGQKMWMTIGLGLIFFTFYLLFVFLGTFTNNSDIRLNFFFLLYEHPTAFIYLGLLLFACISTSVYLARMVIKYLYNKKG